MRSTFGVLSRANVGPRYGNPMVDLRTLWRIPAEYQNFVLVAANRRAVSPEASHL